MFINVSLLSVMIATDERVTRRCCDLRPSSQCQRTDAVFPQFKESEEEQYGSYFVYSDSLADEKQLDLEADCSR